MWGGGGGGGGGGNPYCVRQSKRVGLRARWRGVAPHPKHSNAIKRRVRELDLPQDVDGVAVVCHRLNGFNEDGKYGQCVHISRTKQGLVYCEGMRTM